jgi:hypothetical protein
MTEMPTFLMPSCSITATQPDITATSTPAAIESSVPPAITPAPIYEDPLAPKAGNETYGCRAQWVCVDALASCGDVSTRYGSYVPILPDAPPNIPSIEKLTHHPNSCFNTCTNEGILSTPPCTIAPEPTHAADHQHGPPEPKPESPAPPREHPDFCDEKPYMCAPLGW